MRGELLNLSRELGCFDENCFVSRVGLALSSRAYHDLYDGTLYQAVALSISGPSYIECAQDLLGEKRQLWCLRLEFGEPLITVACASRSVTALHLYILDGSFFHWRLLLNIRHCV